ncbi:peptidase inhibitor family I36 protein [Streptomyces hygroscopicus]|uniref:peptidase inhibitor family I36 protein n=1 Tax=Streptomyces hygroscopicus TaxID=1912 RepID=UPI001FCA8841|nr:peptidase inhibitor family I36 protein [Streptomyces hygroscopicus]
MRNQVLDLISAIAAGDATREEVVAALRNEGIDSLDVLVDILAHVTRKNSRNEALTHPVDLQRTSLQSRPQSHRPTVHKIPRLPFLLRGTLYDPEDIERFNGQELHFVAAQTGDCTLVIDDRELMERWWQLSSLSAAAKGYQHGGYHWSSGVRPQGNPAPTVPSLPEPDIPSPHGTSGPEGYGTASAPPGPPRTVFWEDVNYEGSSIELNANRGYHDLTEVPYTFFGTGDWNDTISSVQMVYTNFAVLYEHVNLAGSTFTCYHGESNLTQHGWNDRASSLETW